MNEVIYRKKLDISYEKILRNYLRTGQETYLYQIAQFSKKLMKLGIGPESIIEIHLNAIKNINKDKEIYSRKDIDESFAVLMEGIMAYGMAYKEYLNSKTEYYLAEIRKLNMILSQRLTEMTALYEAVKVIGSSLDLEKVLSSVFINTVKTLEAEDGSLMLLNPEDKVLTIKKAHGLGEDIIKKTRIKLGEDIAGLVAHTGKPLIIHGRVDGLQIKGRRKYERINSICAPLKTKKGVIGIINLNRKENSEPFTEDDLKLLSAIAHEAASAIENASLYQDLRESYFSTIRALSSALETKNSCIRGHSDAVARYTVAIAERLKLSPQETEGLEVAAILHDVGKIGIPEDILDKPGRLNDAEWSEVKKHPEWSNKIINGISFPWDINPIIYAHHERYDGKGYPAGLKGKEIPLGARIISIADAYDAITSDRTYRKGLRKKEAIKELKRVIGTQLDPEITEVFIEILRSVEAEKRNKII